RPITLYIAFGLLMGYSFWMGASSISSRNFLFLVFLLVLAGGAVWLLEQPRWPAALFTTIIVLLFLGLAVVHYRHAEETEYDAKLIRDTQLTTIVVLSLGLIYAGLACVESFLEPPKSKRIARGKKRRPPRRRDEDWEE